MSANRTELTLIGIILFQLLFSTCVYGETEGLEGRTLTLKECISIGLKQNPLTEISLQNLKAVQEKVGEAWGGYYPSFKLSSSYTFTAQQEIMPIGPDTYDTRFFLRQTLFDAGATSNLVEGVRQTIKAQEYDVKKTTIDIILNIKSAFYETLKRRDLVNVSRSALGSAERHMEQSKASYSEGVSPRSDVIKAEVQVSNARLDVIKAENALLLVKANLVAGMGLPVTTNFEVDAQGSVPQTSTLPALRDTITNAYDGRPEVRGIRARVDSAQTTVKQIRSGLYPNVSLDASYGWQESSFLPSEKKWSVGLTVSIPVFEQLTTRSKINQAAATLNGLKATELQTLRNVELDVEQAWLSLKEALERLGVTEKALEQAEEDMRVSEGRYKEGIGNILEVIDAQTARTQAKTNDVVATYDIATAKAKLERATGEGMREESR